MSESQLFAIAATGLLIGPVLAIWPYRMAKWNEILDAIGRKPAVPVEPADWNVLLTRILGIALVVVGAAATVLYLL